MKHLFLDLEDTIITPAINGWHKVEIVNQDKILEVIEVWKPNFVHIFSFAIWDNEQKRLFEKHTRKLVETAIGCKLSWVPTVDGDIAPTCAKFLKVNEITFQELCDFFGKGGSFKLFVQEKFKVTPADVLLLDDAVKDEDFFIHDLALNGMLRNIDAINRFNL